MNKKGIFGIVAFFTFAFLLYTFANPLEDEQDNFVKDNNNVTNPTNSSDNTTKVEEKTEKVEPEKEEQKTTEAQTTPATNTSRPTTSTSSQTSRPSNPTPVVPTPAPEPAKPTYKNEISNVNVNGLSEASSVSGIKTSGTSYELQGTLIDFYNAIYTVEMHISVPSTYTKDILNNLKISVLDNTYGIYFSPITGSNNIVGEISSGNAYISVPISFTDNVINIPDGPVQISVDWLGDGSPITYNFDFSKLVVNTSN